jgi:hypothetical protein
VRVNARMGRDYKLDFSPSFAPGRHACQQMHSLLQSVGCNLSSLIIFITVWAP